MGWWLVEFDLAVDPDASIKSVSIFAIIMFISSAIVRITS